MKNKKTKIKGGDVIKVFESTRHTMTPVDIFHSREIDRWIVVMKCNECQNNHVFYPFE